MKKLVVVLAVAVLAAGVIATSQWRGLRAQREQGAELAKRLLALESAELAQASIPPAPAAAPLPGNSRLSATALPAQPAAAPAVATQKPAVVAAEAPKAGVLQAMQTPQGRDFTRSMMRGMMSQMYPDLGKELDLTPEEVDRFFNLLSKQQDDLTAETMGLLAGGPADSAARQEMQRSLVKKQLAHQAELAATLGGKYSKWEEYQGTAAARQQVTQLRTSLSSSGNPLTEAQANSLTAAFAEEQGRMRQFERDWMNSAAALNSANLMQEQMQRTMESQRRLVEVATPHLSVTQADQYRRQVEQQVSMLRATMGLMGVQGSKP